MSQKKGSKKQEEFKLSRKDIVEILYIAAFKFFSVFSNHRTSITFKEVHLTDHLRVDVFNISYDDSIVILELKTCRQDFESDSKWKNYLEYCDRFYFVCPTDVIKESELPNGIGLIYVNTSNDKNPYFSIIKKPEKLKPKYLTNAWLKYIYKKLFFRKFLDFKGKQISLGDERFF